MMQKRSKLGPFRVLGYMALSNVAACASRPPLEHVGRSIEPPPTAELSEELSSPTETSEDTQAEAPPEDVVQKARLPFQGVRSADGAELEPEALMTELAHADVICVGERHDVVSDHFAQLATLEALLARRESAGFELGLGLEMFQAPFQYALDAYAQGRIDRPRLVAVSKYQERWGFPIQYYAPLLHGARTSGTRLLALNARSELTQAIAQDGLEALPANLSKELPQLNLDDSAHRALFDQLMEGHPPTGAIDHLYQAQVVWDETMATRAAAWLKNRAPARKLLILAGRAHCARPGIPARVERRGPFRVVSVLPRVEGEGSNGPSRDPDDPSGSIYDYHFVMRRP